MKTITLKAVLESPLHIGGEVRKGTDADRPMLKTHNNRPYIPATSIKGRLRHAVERLARAELGAEAVRTGITAEALVPWRRPYCPVAWLFGSPWQESRLYFTDLTLADEENRLPIGDSPSTQARPGVRLNRVRRVVEDRFFFTTELFEPGIPWTFSGEVYHRLDEVDLAPLYMAVRAVTMLGGGRSRGLGWVKLEAAPMPDDLDVMWQIWKQRTDERKAAS